MKAYAYGTNGAAITDIEKPSLRDRKFWSRFTPAA